MLGCRAGCRLVERKQGRWGGNVIRFAEMSWLLLLAAPSEPHWKAPSSEATTNSLTSERRHLRCALPSHPLLAESYSVNFSVFLACTFLSLTDPHSSGLSRVGVGATLLEYHVGLLSKTYGTVYPSCADIGWAKGDEHKRAYFMWKSDHKKSLQHA